MLDGGEEVLAATTTWLGAAATAGAATPAAGVNGDVGAWSGPLLPLLLLAEVGPL